MAVYEKVPCKICGAKFIRTKRNEGLFTCYKCRQYFVSKAWKDKNRIPTETYVCETCGAEFRRQYPTMKFCSKKCWPLEKLNYEHMKKAS